MTKQNAKPTAKPCFVHDCGGRKYAAVIRTDGSIAYVIDGKTAYLTPSQVRDEQWRIDRI